MNNIETAALLKTELDQLRPISEVQERRIWQKFRFDWTYHSNKIEGNSLTFGETKALLLHNITAQGKPLKDHLEISGHNEAINTLLDVAKAQEPLTEILVRNLHTLILRERYRSQATTLNGGLTSKWIEVGTYKATPNHVITSTGEVFHFAEPYEVPAKMQSLVQAFNDSVVGNLSLENSITAACKVHYDFVRIHPFDDGNGRMARLLMNLLFIKHGLPPAIIKDQEKSEYLTALQQADSGQFEFFVDFIAKCLCSSLTIMIAGAKGLSIEEPDHEDKKIKVLTKLLEQQSKKLTVGRNAESISAVFNFVFLPLAAKLHQATEKFTSLYFETKSNAFKDDQALVMGTKTFIDMLGSEIDISANTDSLMWQAQFLTLRFSTNTNYNYSQWLTLKFDNAGYVISSTFRGQPIRKAYDERLGDDEMISLVKAMKSFHIEAIEQATGVKVPI